MNNRGSGNAGGNSDQQNALSLLVNAADSRDSPRSAAAESLRLRAGLAASGGGGGGGTSSRGGGNDFGGGGGGGGSGEPSLEEQLFLHQQQQQQQAQQASYGSGGGGGGGSSSQAALLSQLQRDQNLLSQWGQQQQLASLLGLGGGGTGGGGGAGSSASAAAQANQEMQRALAAQLQRQSQQPQLSNADLLALSRSGMLQGLLGGGTGSSSAAGLYAGLGAGALQGAGAYGGAAAHQGLASELENLQRLEELNRRQRLLAVNSESSRPGRGGGGGGVDAAAALASAEAAARFDPVVAQTAIAASLGGQDKEDLEKSPGSVIVPCRARGMPMDHNFKTAYFVIPENVKHGEELICSYFACRNAGIKFRYCSHCKVPVAKRNFRKRHKHGGEPVPVKGEDSGGEEDLPKKGIPMQITASREEAAEADGISSQSADSAHHNHQHPHHHPHITTEADVQQGLVRNSMRTFETSKSKNKAKAISHASGGRISKERQQRWLSLLAKRPSTKESDTMSAWLMQVLAVSDLETPLRTTAAVADGLDGTTTATSTKKENNILKKSSGTNDSTRSDIGYGTSSEDSAGSNSTNGNNKKEQGEVMEEKEKPKAAALMMGDTVVQKKKRPIDGLLNDEDDDVGNNMNNNKRSEAFVSGSFAEWKERKKQRKQMKTSGSNSGASHQESG